MLFTAYAHTAHPPHVYPQFKLRSRATLVYNIQNMPPADGGTLHNIDLEALNIIKKKFCIYSSRRPTDTQVIKQ